MTTQIVISEPFPNPSSGSPITFHIHVPGQSTVTLDVFTLLSEKYSVKRLRLMAFKLFSGI
jgi:hypothetical protein